MAPRPGAACLARSQRSRATQILVHQGKSSTGDERKEDQVDSSQKVVQGWKALSATLVQRNVNRCLRIRSPCFSSPSFDLNSSTVSIRGPRAGSSRISSSASALPRHTPSPPPGVVGTDAVRQRQGPQQLSTVRCPSRLWFRRHRRSARSGSGRNQDRERRQGCRITVVIALSRPHPAALNNRLLRTGRRWRGSPGPARPDRWRQESTRIGSTAAPAPPKPRAILKDRNHSGLLPLQSFMAGRSGERQLTVLRGPAWLC